MLKPSHSTMLLRRGHRNRDFGNVLSGPPKGVLELPSLSTMRRLSEETDYENKTKTF